MDRIEHCVIETHHRMIHIEDQMRRMSFIMSDFTTETSLIDNLPSDIIRIKDSTISNKQIRTNPSEVISKGFILLFTYYKKYFMFYEGRNNSIMASIGNTTFGYDESELRSRVDSLFAFELKLTIIKADQDTVSKLYKYLS